MIFQDQVQNVAEHFITETLIKWPKLVEVLLSHPSWKKWCAEVAVELTKQQTISEIENKPFNPLKEIQVWAASYADHAISNAEDTYFRQVKDSGIIPS